MNSRCPSIRQVQGVPARHPLPCFPGVPLIVLEVIDLHFPDQKGPVCKDMNEKRPKELFVLLF